MTFYKKISCDINVNGKKRKDLPLNAEIFSYDEQVAKFVLTLINDIDEIDLSGAEVLAIMEYTVDGVGGSVEAISGIESVNENSIYFIVPEKLRGFEGSVTAGVYVNLSSGEKIDIQNLKFKMSRSLVDSTSGPAADFYFESFDDVLVKVKVAGDKAITDINSEAQRVSAHADQKISEYDAKFAQSDQKMSQLQNSQTALDSKLTETQQKITDADVYTKAESSANVIDQISGIETAIVSKKILVDGIGAIGARNVNGTIEPFSQADYDNLIQNITIRTETTVSGNAAQFEFSFDVVEYIESKYPSVFWGLTSTTDKLNKLKTVLKSVKIPHLARGAVSSKFDWWNYQTNTWSGISFSNTAVGFIEKIYEINTITDITFSRLFGNTGVFKSRIYSGLVSDGTQKSWLELKDFSLVIELELSAKDIIDCSIAAYHIENVQPQITDLAARVLALESKSN
ncbi:BppU family phage baseplate upper protein [Enterococcus pseudoavium]|uniref:BppU family phage baseplate upper protein n=1 Tax=Enterococcus pseudoavium TaxID=44007 RepID=A0AAE4I5F6_9ENTE|nr:BppU family phage baseplate upper protein [Enterococcus pseudoavium]MDT2737966.1 BppU family phage baseplate upper protein [Enterococcus pseudoavium]